ncbi:MAG: hypothetical protein U9R19_06125 [Bacteroidota bacterium]|nr:hypothetical protein [Bacteroidota bacterium]
MKKINIKLLALLFFLISILFVTCENNFENVIDDDRIIGTWHRKNYIENGVTIAEQDSIVYHFIDDGRMKILYFSNQSASQPDEDYQFDFQGGILRYWNSNINVSEEKQVYFYGAKMRIQVYPNYFYELTKIF